MPALSIFLRASSLGVNSYSSPTWIWCVNVDNKLYVRAYNGIHSSWYQSAKEQKAGIIQSGGMSKEVIYEPISGEINHRIDAAYQKKYAGSPYLNAMISNRAKAATVHIY